MCGIVGFATNKPRAGLKDFMAQGLIVDSLRGMCGTGIYAYDTKDKEAWVWKRALSGYDFVNTLQFSQFADKANFLPLVIGHNRASTIGAAKDANCHPFVYDHIGLVHNGTLRNYHTLVKGYQEFNHPVDSAYAAYAMAKYGVVETLEKIEGAFVFVWHDMKENTLNIARNSMRDIWYITDKEGENLYFASEYQMLDWLLARQNFATWGKYKSPAEFTILSWELGKPFKQPAVRKFEEYTPPKYNSNPIVPWSGRTHGRRTKDEDDLLDFGIDQFEILTVKDLKFELYNGPAGKGKVDGKCVVGVKEYNFRCHGVDKEEFEKTLTAKSVSSPAVSVWFADKEPTVIGRRLIIEPEAAADAEDEEGGAGVLPALFPGPDKKLYGREEFSKLVAAGCCYCGDPLTPDNAQEIEWMHMTDHFEPVCAKCTNDPTTAMELRWFHGHDRFGGYDYD